MKKKFVLILALVLMVAVGLSAATPLTVGGTFKTGYTFTFAGSTKTIAGSAVKTEAKNAAISVAGDFWKVSLDAKAGMLFDAKMAAKAEIYLDKALAAQGTDMGDLTMKLTIGNMADLGGLSAYTNSRDDLASLKMKSGVAGAYASSLTIGYGKMVTFLVGADPVSFTGTGSNNAFIVSAKSEPVDGVSVAVAYTNVDANAVDGAIAGSVAVDVAKLASIEDFGLTLSAYDVFLLTGDVNKLYVELKGSYDKFSAWTEYRILNKTNDMKLNVSFSGIENVGLSAFVELNDLTKVVAYSTKIGAGATYKMGGVTYALDVDYAIEAKTFTMSPTVKIAF